MMENNLITVQYVNINDYHLFKSLDNPLTDGLCAGSSDLKTAFNEVSYQLKNLLKHNHNIDCDPSPSVSYDDFEMLVKDLLAKSSNNVQIIPTAYIEINKQAA